MMNRVSAIALLTVFVGSLYFTGCTRRLGDFSIVSTKNYERSVEYRNLGRFEGDDMVLLILGIPLGFPTFEGAVDDVLEKAGGVYLANAVINYSQWFVILVGQQGYKVEGDVYAPVGVGDAPVEGEEYETFSLVETDDGSYMESSKTGKKVAVQEMSDVLEEVDRLNSQ